MTVTIMIIQEVETITQLVIPINKLRYKSYF
jgi:hypothetical protein